MDLSRWSCTQSKPQLESLPLLALGVQTSFSSSSSSPLCCCPSCPSPGGCALSCHREQFSIPLSWLKSLNPSRFWAQHNHISKSLPDKCLTLQSFFLHENKPELKCSIPFCSVHIYVFSKWGHTPQLCSPSSPGSSYPLIILRHQNWFSKSLLSELSCFSLRTQTQYLFLACFLFNALKAVTNVLFPPSHSCIRLSVLGLFLWVFFSKGKKWNTWCKLSPLKQQLIYNFVLPRPKVNPSRQLLKVVLDARKEQHLSSQDF